MHQYDFDASTAIAFLKTYDIDFMKLNLEGNHANLAGHTYQHEIRTAREAGVLGSLDANQGDKLIGWDMMSSRPTCTRLPPSCGRSSPRVRSALTAA